MATEHYDLIIIGAGAAGGALARQLAPGGKRILLLERGPWLPREKRNWDVTEVAVNACYNTSDVWLDKHDAPVHSNDHYFVGGNSKFWGAALFRLRERDFERVEHPGGISPEWPVKYPDFEPYYTLAEQLYDAHGLRGEDPTAPPMSSEEYPHPPISHEPRIQEISDELVTRGLHPFHLPTAIRINEAEPHLSECIRCNTCDGFPCLVSAKADGEWNGVRHALPHPNITLLTEAYVSRLLTSPSGREVTGVETQIDGEMRVFSADIVVVSCGAINSAALLLRSAGDRHPRGLANSSDQVGRNYMCHLLGALSAVSSEPNPTIFQKTLGLNDFYWGEDDYPYPMGNIQSTGKVFGAMLAAQNKEPVAGLTFDAMAAQSTDWWFMTEDLPNPDNRVTWERDTIRISYTDTNRASHDRLEARWIETLQSMEMCDAYMRMNPYVQARADISIVAHQCGTCRFGTDQKTSVLDIHCRTHDIDNLYVVDSSFYPSSAALNPTLTLLANALRVAEHLHERMR